MGESGHPPDHQIDSMLRRLRDAWAPGWRIWRARRDRDGAGERTGDWFASRILGEAGVDPTIGADSAAALDRELKQQAEMAMALARLTDALLSWDVRAIPAGLRRVRLVHTPTGRRDVIVLNYSERWRGPAWYWLWHDGTELIGPADGLELVTGRIVDAISRPRAAVADRPGGCGP